MSDPLPAAVLIALRSIAADLGDVPRECCADQTEMLLWLRRMARRVEGILSMRVPQTPKNLGQKHKNLGQTRKLLKRQAGKISTARAAADALFKPSHANRDERPTDVECRTQGKGRRTLSLRQVEADA